ncbi:MAG: hypothetical protein GAK33_04989 [Burkholderia lata]|uniref:Uncharacterized protein n=1 Tax=Burkholderia lata (strain ATCC 17760 / DSM 23089 / LMG 22485 / NCIMB 9086 / R18194 / 383) TaxID=482957 RepID=A0A833UJ99_BURL3|nr:hypothetical protein [Burkholderia lata]KAF1035081.1 MAG: hypothetical protein GAK33_04989 [Burkholderia lata]
MQTADDGRLIMRHLRAAFSERVRPTSVVPAVSSNTNDYSDALHFSNLLWDETSAHDWTTYADAIYRFTPDAFCYFLPGIMRVSVEDNQVALTVVESLIGSLDRSPVAEYWDDYFLQRWPKLTDIECDAVIEWIGWLNEHPLSPFAKDTILRACETLELVKMHRTA